MGNLSAREKTMLYILLCIVILAAGFFFLVKPTVNRYNEMVGNLDEATSNQVTMQTVSATEDTNKKRLKEINKSLDDEIFSYFFEPKFNEDIDELLTTMAKRNGLLPESLTMTNIHVLGQTKDDETEENGEDSLTDNKQEDEVAALIEQQVQQTETADQTSDGETIVPTAEDGAEQTEDMEEAEETVSSAAGSILACTVTMELSGDVGAFINFVNEITITDSMRVVAFSKVEKEEKDSLFGQTVGVKIGYTVTVQVLMYQDLYAGYRYTNLLDLVGNGEAASGV